MQKLCKGEGGGGKVEKREGAAASNVRGSTGRHCLKKIFFNFKGGGGVRLTQGGGGGGGRRMPPPPP